jgi:hypothetical protein
MPSSFLNFRALCRLIRYGVVVLVVATLVAHLWVWFALGNVQIGALTFFIHSGDLDAKSLAVMTLLERSLTIFISLPALFFLMIAFFKLVKLMRNFERRDFFIMSSILLLKGFCGAIFLHILCSMIEPVARMLAFSLINSAHQPELVLRLTDSFDELLLCGVFYVIARMMEEGRRIAEENSEFI